MSYVQSAKQPFNMDLPTYERVLVVAGGGMVTFAIGDWHLAIRMSDELIVMSKGKGVRMENGVCPVISDRLVRLPHFLDSIFIGLMIIMMWQVVPAIVHIALKRWEVGSQDGCVRDVPLPGRVCHWQATCRSARTIAPSSSLLGVCVMDLFVLALHYALELVIERMRYIWFDCVGAI
jgi:hypothetical protein